MLVGPWPRTPCRAPGSELGKTVGWGAGDLFERQMYDAGLNEHEKAFWDVITSGEKKHGTWRSATLIAVEDEHLLWWLTKSASSLSTYAVDQWVAARPWMPTMVSLAAFHTDFLRAGLVRLQKQKSGMVAGRCSKV